MDHSGRYSTWVEIDLDAIESNVKYFSALGRAQVMAVVKANAYGHGACEVAVAALRGGASWLAVAHVEEAHQIRQAGIEAEVLLLGYTPPSRYLEMVQNDIALTIWDAQQLGLVSRAGQDAGMQARLHLKVDTGMSRLGLRPVEVLDMATAIEQTPGVSLEGVFTHLACADETDPVATDLQLSRFAEVIEKS